MDRATVLEEIRLPSFKSLRSATLPIRDLTLLVGRNGSGKSNVLDGVSVLARLAGGGDIRDELDGGRDGPAVRGGAEGCAPIGADRFELGCTVGTPEARIHLDVVIGVRPVVQIVSERLQIEPRTPQSTPRVLLESGPADPASIDLPARWHGRRRSGPTAAVTFRATQLLTSQVAMRVPVTTQAARDVHEAAEAVLRALRGVFLLDPVPAAMRQYVPTGDNRLRRRADNLSAVLGRLMAQPTVYDRLLEVMRTLSESRLEALATEASPLGDLMFVQREIVGDREAIVPARLMSDGTLRVLAVVAALLETTVERPSAASRAEATKTLVIEEIENGLHPSQAAAIVRRVVEESRPRAIRTLATTHSPAMLDALDGTHHDGVLICVRDERGWTRLHPLTQLPNYFNVVARGTLGDAATSDRLRPRTATRTPAELIEELFGDG